MKKENIFGRMRNFLTDVRGELKKVTWPNRGDLQKTTIAVIVLSVIIGLYLWLIDLSFQVLIRRVMDIFK
jgi:preprotein translocase subunit SecE